ncbi:hypothetical protein SDC9_87082 [bioreactor metagenome]|uniref:Uncharacterized protein n=1 Tax=bioreactor metagenome TaxID=1076179 RepID=A0A644ZKP1_9ZZZZ
MLDTLSTSFKEELEDDTGSVVDTSGALGKKVLDFYELADIPKDLAMRPANATRLGAVFAGPGAFQLIAELLDCDRLARAVLDVGPRLVDHVLHAVGHGHVVQIGRGLVTVLVGPLEELQRRGGLHRLVLHLVHQDEGGAGDGPGTFTRLVRQDLIEALAPVGTGSGGLEGGVVRLHELACAVLQQGVGHLVLLHIGVLDVANGVGQTAHESGHAFVALAACAGGPVHGRAFTHLVFPLGVHLRQIVGEQEAGARAIGAAHRSDVGVRQLDVGVQCGDGCIVPLGDLAQVDVAQHLAAELELACLDALDVHHGDHATDHGGELHQALLVQLVVLQGSVGSAEVHGLGFDLTQTGTRTHGLVVDLDAGCLVVVGCPLGVQRSREAGASAGGFALCHGGRESTHRHQTRHQNANCRHCHERDLKVEQTNKEENIGWNEM